MKPLNFLSLFAGFFVLLMLLGIVFSLINYGDLSTIVYVVLISMIVALFMASMTIRIRAADPLDITKLIRLNFILWLPYWLAKMVFIRMNDISELGYLKLLLLLGIAVVGSFLFAKLATIIPKRDTEF